MGPWPLLLMAKKDFVQRTSPEKKRLAPALAAMTEAWQRSLLARQVSPQNRRKGPGHVPGARASPSLEADVTGQAQGLPSPRVSSFKMGRAMAGPLG